MKRVVAIVVMMLNVATAMTAQCAMCKSAVETTDNAGFVAALRDGIYLMLVTPYLIAAAIALAVFVRWRKRRRIVNYRLN